MKSNSEHPRQLNYILYSDNVYWLIYQFSSGQYQNKVISYDIVVRDAKTGDFRRVRATWKIHWIH